ncbi:hypothetical protein MCOR27_003322 [Pyricularia oryzae]|uniref:Uncharacterized protein n=2 Tax=Pyricularia TaxID=48558 RepID=A0ABQ8P0X7_PYRGI|nr:hypothetical protein MCOR01_011797 [Pyricularia oryzae]KAI6304967.1 hypothetical protein MCOR33_000087 [Pyricularia grisea]KAI6259077.1 hypothetical protein MCOR19_004553 [Pyricularia oryzae]KAI6276496.1 hypothetical protein MCOR26_005586 [Pyricularia oryzae]KAI6283260.1 hypothetical protein MCOR27_003322 [Pyricularia oryzae]
MPSPTVYAITGANKGIGRAIVALLLSRPSTIILALVRNPSDPTSSSLTTLAKSPSSTIHVLPFDAEADAIALPSGVAHIDVVVANAGASSGYKPVLATGPEDLIFDFTVNAVGPLRLFKAAWPLLQKAPASPRFVLMTSSVGSIAGQQQESFPSTAYGMSKAAANWLLVKIGVEHGPEGLSVMALHPGWVKTQMGQGIADSIGFPEPPTTTEDSARACVEQIDKLEKANSGRYVTYTGEVLPW